MTAASDSTVDLLTGNTLITTFAWEPNAASFEPSVTQSREAGTHVIRFRYWTTSNPKLAAEAGRFLFLAIWPGLRQQSLVGVRDDGGYAVEGEALLGEFTKDGLTNLENALGEKLGVPTDGAVVEAVYSVQAIMDALELSREYDGMMRRVAAARDCIDKPVLNQNEADRERLRELVDQVDGDLTGSMVVRFIAATTSQAANLVTGLGYVVSPGLAEAVATLTMLSEQRLAEVENAITDCEGLAYYVGSYSDGWLTDIGIAIVACGDPSVDGWVVASAGKWDTGIYVEGPALVDYIDLYPLSESRGPGLVWRVRPGEWGELASETGADIFVEYLTGPPARASLLIQVPDWVSPQPGQKLKAGDELFRGEVPLLRMPEGTALPEACGF